MRVFWEFILVVAPLVAPIPHRHEVHKRSLNGGFAETLAETAADLSTTDLRFLEHLRSRTPKKSLDRELLFQAAVKGLRGLMEAAKKSPRAAKLIAGPLGPPISSSIKQLKVKISRQQSQFPLQEKLKSLMSDQEGSIRGTWFEHQSKKKTAPLATPLESSVKNIRPDERIILYVHGGGFIVGSTSTHQGIIASLAKNSGAKVFCKIRIWQHGTLLN